MFNSKKAQQRAARDARINGNANSYKSRTTCPSCGNNDPQRCGTCHGRGTVAS